MQSPNSRRPEVEHALREADHPLSIAEVAASSGCPVITVRRQVTALVTEGKVTRLDETTRDTYTAGRTGRVPDLYQWVH